MAMPYYVTCSEVLVSEACDWPGLARDAFRASRCLRRRLRFQVRGRLELEQRMGRKTDAYGSGSLGPRRKSLLPPLPVQ